MIFSANLPVSCASILDYEETEPRSLCPQIKTLKPVKSKVRSGLASSVLLASSQLGRYTWPDQKLAFQSMKFIVFVCCCLWSALLMRMDVRFNFHVPSILPCIRIMPASIGKSFTLSPHVSGHTIYYPFLVLCSYCLPVLKLSSSLIRAVRRSLTLLIVCKGCNCVCLLEAM